MPLNCPQQFQECHTLVVVEAPYRHGWIKSYNRLGIRRESYCLQALYSRRPKEYLEGGPVRAVERVGDAARD